MAQKRPSKSDRRESGIVQHVRNTVRQLPVDSPHVLLACSGGKDSVALAWILAELRRLQLLTFSIAHIHHGQHDNADLAADAVREIGRLLDARITVHRLHQRDIDAHSGVGLEEAMRRERYLALFRIAVEQGADCIALAHHQTDQAETILLHLMRGAGVDGLAGMREWEVRRIPWWDESAEVTEIGLWRPLISQPERRVADIAASSGLPIVEDPTNSDPSFRRNAIRHQVLPVLEGISAGSVGSVARSAEVIAADAELLEHLTRQALAVCTRGDGLLRSRLMVLSEAMQKRVIRRWVADRLPMLELTSDRIAAISTLVARNRGGAVIEIGSGHRVTIRDGRLSLD